jgi:hypothetical protein
VQEVHGEASDLRAPEVEDQVCAGRAEFAQVREEHAFLVADRLECPEVRGRDRQDHAFLCFADPDFGVREPGVLERRSLEMHGGPDLPTHFADRRGEPARAAIGHAVIERACCPGATGAQDRVEHPLLLYCVSNLHGVREFRGRG